MYLSIVITTTFQVGIIELVKIHNYNSQFIEI